MLIISNNNFKDQELINFIHFDYLNTINNQIFICLKLIFLKFLILQTFTRFIHSLYPFINLLCDILWLYYTQKAIIF